MTRRKMMMVSASIVIVSSLGAVLALFLGGNIPATVTGSYSVLPFGNTLRAVDSTGQVDLTVLRAHEAELNQFIDSLAAKAPSATPEDRLAYWLNAYHALVLRELLDGSSMLSRSWKTWPIDGHHLNRWSIEQRLASAHDARVHLALFTGARGGPLLDGVPFDPELLDSQLNDAARRLMRRTDVVEITAGHVALAQTLLDHEQVLLEALPDGRKHLLQIVWAFLPDSCDDIRPGCNTRRDLDTACHAQFSKCTVSAIPFDASPAVRPTP